ncbi:MAG: heat-inducible transcriptional repressor HrcA [Chloroflexota bacterium]
MPDLTERQQAILKLIVSDFIRSAVPVASVSLLKNYRLGVSSATVRNDMSYLEELGYICQPHTSAGRVPTDKGYRYFVEWLMDDAELTPEEQRTVLHQFHQVESDVTQWTQLAAAVLAGMVQTASVVTLPAAPQCRLKHLDLIDGQDGVVLLIVVLAEGMVRQQLLNLPKLGDEEELEKISNRFNRLFRGRTADQIRLNASAMSPVEAAVKDALVRIMSQADLQKYQNAYLDGIVSMLSQPEFSQADRMRRMVEVLHSRSMLASLLTEAISGEGVRVMIGQENQWDALQQCSVIVSRYGVGGDISGVLGVLGPTRLPYNRAISAVRYTCAVMNDLMREYFC